MHCRHPSSLVYASYDLVADWRPTGTAKVQLCNLNPASLGFQPYQGPVIGNGFRVEAQRQTGRSLEGAGMICALDAPWQAPDETLTMMQRSSHDMSDKHLMCVIPSPDYCVVEDAYSKCSTSHWVPLSHRSWSRLWPFSWACNRDPPEGAEVAVLKKQCPRHHLMGSLEQAAGEPTHISSLTTPDREDERTRQRTRS